MCGSHMAGGEVDDPVVPRRCRHAVDRLDLFPIDERVGWDVRNWKGQVQFKLKNVS